MTDCMSTLNLDLPRAEILLQGVGPPGRPVAARVPRMIRCETALKALAASSDLGSSSRTRAARLGLGAEDHVYDFQPDVLFLLSSTS